MNKLAEVAANHIDPKTNGNFMGADAQAVAWVDGIGEQTVDLYTQFRIN